MQLNVSNSPIGRPAGGARVEAETHTPARPRAEKCAQDHDHPARAVVHRPSTRPPRAINKLVINGPCDAHGARTRSGETAQTEPKRRPQGKRTRVYTDSRFQFHTATRTGHKFQVTNFVHGRPRVGRGTRACDAASATRRWPLRAAGGPQPHSALWAYQRYNFSKIRYSDHGPRRLLYVYLGMMPPAFMAAGHVGVSLVAFSPATPRACGSDDAHLRVDHARHAHDKVHVQVRHTVGAAPVECLVDVQVV